MDYTNIGGFMMFHFKGKIVNDPGEVAEWSNALVLKTSVLQGTGGSNPSFTATKASSEKSEEAFCVSVEIRKRSFQRTIETQKAHAQHGGFC